jgi:hypothetical protein
MRPGPTIIKKCSDCSEFFQQHTIKSGNTFYGAILWTDGKRETGNSHVPRPAEAGNVPTLSSTAVD